jgi:hypothetical protein
MKLASLETLSCDAGWWPWLAHARRRSPIPLFSGENLYTLRGFRPYLEASGPGCGCDVVEGVLLGHGSTR